MRRPICYIEIKIKSIPSTIIIQFMIMLYIHFNHMLYFYFIKYSYIIILQLYICIYIFYYSMCCYLYIFKSLTYNNQTIQQHRNYTPNIMNRYWCYICQKQFQLSPLANKACTFCQQQAFEQMTAQTHPQHFPVYATTTNQNSQQSQPQSQSQQNSTQPQLMQPVQVMTQMLQQVFGGNQPSPGLVQSLSGISNIIQQAIQTSITNIQSNPNLQNAQNPTMLLMASANSIGGTLASRMPQLLGHWNTVATFISNNLPQGSVRATQQQINQLQKISHTGECTICQGSNDENPQGLKLRCNHEFHQACIRPWFERANTCPTCRARI